MGLAPGASSSGFGGGPLGGEPQTADRPKDPQAKDHLEDRREEDHLDNRQEEDQPKGQQAEDHLGDLQALTPKPDRGLVTSARAPGDGPCTSGEDHAL